MAQIVPFPRRVPDHGSSRQTGPAQILFFIGVRYERQITEPTRPLAPRTKRRTAAQGDDRDERHRA